MKFLPTENITYKTRLNEDEIIRRLSDHIEPEKTFRFGIFSSDSPISYEGQINGQTFNIRRITRYQNSFLPRIYGVLERDSDGLTIKVKMRLHIVIIVFLCIWCIGVGVVFITFLTQDLNRHENNPETLIPIGMLLFAYLVTMGGFKFESNKSKNDLLKIFKAEIIDG